MSAAAERWEHFNPVRVVAGAGALDALPGLLPASGTILLVTTAGFSRRGTSDRIRRLVDGQDRRLLVHDAVTPNPTLDDLEATAVRLGANAPAAVVALGGGSALDAGKVLAAIVDAAATRPLHRAFREGQACAWRTRVPVFTVPTTAGTGAETTPFATVWDPATGRKFSVDGDGMFPSACLLDPELTLSLGPEDTLYPALDTVSHALESLWNRRATPVTRALALQGLRLSVRHLPAVLADGGNLEARAGLQQASLLAAQAITRTRTALAHSISYPLTLAHGVPHGLACSFTLPALLRRHAAALAEDDGEAALFRNVQALLAGLDLPAHLARHATTEQVLALLPRMHTPGRADNFAFAADAEDVVREALAGHG
jgi:alcohol dehydrogenase